MSTSTGSLRKPDLRARAMKGSLIALAVVYVVVLLMAPIVGIAWKA
ncbi:MAG: hypothetical protein QOF16_1181, partial [Actinomycetota bacterium]|nr:hypothetical protein [Actinomycetota bacterium]